MTDGDATRGHIVTDPDREQALADVFVALADTLVDDYDVAELLDRLTTACVDLLGVRAAGLLLDDQKGNLAVVASSSDEIRLLEVFQLQTNEGPCLDCFRTGTAVTSADLDAERDRWPQFVAAALAAGFASVAALPMRLRSQTIGALNIFHTRAEPVLAKDQRLAQALADVATIGILQRRSVHRSSVMAEQLQHALNCRVIIEQAKGVLAERLAVDMDTAFESLRGYARHYNLKLTETAHAVTRGVITVDALTDPPSGAGRS